MVDSSGLPAKKYAKNEKSRTSYEQRLSLTFHFMAYQNQNLMNLLEIKPS